MPPRESYDARDATASPSLDAPALNIFIPSCRRTRDEQAPPNRDRERSRNRTSRARRQHRRITGYHNFFDELAPPDYDICAGPSPPAVTAPPPEYECSVEASDVVEIVWERTSPFHPVQVASWQNVHIALRGTLLQVSNAKTHGLLTPAWKRGQPTGEPGRKIKSYTLQHAEIGLASDHRRVEMVPKSPIAQLLPESALKQLQVSDPSQFDIVYNYIARLRVESEQILLRFQSNEQRMTWIEKICAAIDIAPPLEARGEPKNFTLPRRRRRQEAPRIVIRTNNTHASASTSLVAEQERILRQHYPHLLSGVQPDAQEHRSSPTDSPDTPQDNDDDESRQDEGQQQEPDNEPDPDYQDLDLAFMRDPMAENDPEDEERHLSQMSNIFSSIGQREAVERQSATTGNDMDFSGPVVLHGESPRLSNLSFDQLGVGLYHGHNQSVANFSTQEHRKSAPRSSRRDALRDARYRRRCMPMLVHNSRYASNVIMHKGKRKVIDWHNKKLVPWPAEPPSYQKVLYSNASMEPSNRKCEQPVDAESRDNLPPGAANAVLRFRNLLRRQVSSVEMAREPMSIHSAGFRTTENLPRSSERVETPPSATRDANVQNCDQDSPIDPAFFGHAFPTSRTNPTCQEPLESTPSITVTTANNHTGYTSGSDDQASKSPAVSFDDPNVKAKANNNTFGRRLREKFGRRFTNNDNSARDRHNGKRPQTRMQSRAESRATDCFDEGIEDKTAPSRFPRLRTVSSMDIMRSRF
ncbi:MAG: hypothetical protein Q9162_000007 [Coniocarpon cinnabarinum]